MKPLSRTQMSHLAGGGCDELAAAAVAAFLAGQVEISVGLMAAYYMMGCGSAT